MQLVAHQHESGLSCDCGWWTTWWMPESWSVSPTARHNRVYGARAAQGERQCDRHQHGEITTSRMSERRRAASSRGRRRWRRRCGSRRSFCRALRRSRIAADAAHRALTLVARRATAVGRAGRDRDAVGRWLLAGLEWARAIDDHGRHAKGSFAARTDGAAVGIAFASARFTSAPHSVSAAAVRARLRARYTVGWWWRLIIGRNDIGTYTCGQEAEHDDGEEQTHW